MVHLPRVFRCAPRADARGRRDAGIRTSRSTSRASRPRSTCSSRCRSSSASSSRRHGGCTSCGRSSRPGFKAREKRYTIGFLGASIPLFFGGVALPCGCIRTPRDVLLDFTPNGGSNYLDAQNFMSFAMRLVLAFGLAFVFPVVMVALTAAGHCEVAGRGSRAWRWAVFIIFVFAAIMTPTPDAVTMIIMALPMVGCSSPPSLSRATLRAIQATAQSRAAEARGRRAPL